ncbi:Flp family type IVb pilin [Burkholderia sp. Bp8963]|uniref:Flp family type IVb pilin n=1 Tax=Burkholderia sp. Bp8963 TaxID=2184547 RepID=UPI000F59619A|nr:Flp family type IVb pilin [Burkholderia sp. Bp8963]RQS74424.1 Flp family type IVb pilin [Burkholderia sp. Bp8963]
MLQYAKSLLRDERGVSALEYSVLAGIVVVALGVVGSVLSSNTGGLPAIFSSLLAKASAMI